MAENIKIPHACLNAVMVAKYELGLRGAAGNLACQKIEPKIIIF